MSTQRRTLLLLNIEDKFFNQTIVKEEIVKEIKFPTCIRIRGFTLFRYEKAKFQSNK